jgi:signal transduction histidine kinase
MKLNNNSRPTVINDTSFYSLVKIMVENASDVVLNQGINNSQSGADNKELSSNYCLECSSTSFDYKKTVNFSKNIENFPLSETDWQTLHHFCKDEKAFKELQEILIKAWGDNPEKTRLKDVVLHTVAHDLRTSVLGTLMLFQHLMSQQDEIISISRSVVDRLVQGNKRHLEMINALLETYFPEDKAIVLASPLTFSALLEMIFKDLTPMIEKYQLNLINLVSVSLPPVLAEPVQVQRVLETLITHIAERNPPGLTLTIKAELEGQMILCSITNNGSEMNQFECHQLFDLYIREPQHRSGTSTGLKLYLCRQIIRSLKGEIGVELSANFGFRFWFTLPIVMAV